MVKFTISTRVGTKITSNPDTSTHHGVDDLLGEIVVWSAVVLSLSGEARLADAVDLLVDLRAVVVSLLTGASDGDGHTRRPGDLNDNDELRIHTPTKSSSYHDGSEPGDAIVEKFHVIYFHLANMTTSATNLHERSHFEETLGDLERELLGVPPGGDARVIESASLGHTGGVEHLIRDEDLVDGQLQTP